MDVSEKVSFDGANAVHFTVVVVFAGVMGIGVVVLFEEQVVFLADCLHCFGLVWFGKQDLKYYVFIIFAKKEFNFMGTVGFRPYDPSLFIFIIFPLRRVQKA